MWKNKINQEIKIENLLIITLILFITFIYFYAKSIENKMTPEEKKWHEEMWSDK